MSIVARTASCIVLAWAIIVPGGFTLSAKMAASNTVAISVTAGYGGSFRSNAWLPVRALLTNSGSDVTATIIIADDRQQSSNVSPYNRAEYVRTVFLPAGSTKDVVEYIPGADVGPAVTVSLSTSNGQVTRRSVPVTQVPPGSSLVGILSSTLATYTQFKAFGGALEGVRTIATPLNSGGLDPQAGALASLDCIVLANFDASTLVPEQVSSIDAWVRGGGSLVIIGGPTASATLGTLPADLVPIKLTAPRITSNLPGLGALAKSRLTASVVVASGVPIGGEVVLDASRFFLAGDASADSKLPIVVQNGVGLGSVTYSAIDPSLPPIAQWQGLERFWRVLTAQSRAGATTATFRLAGVEPISGVSTLASEITGVTPPSITVFLLLLGVYVCILVPANFIILFKIRRRDLSWFTLPALSALLVAAVFAAARLGRGTDPRLSVVSVIYLTGGSHAAQSQDYIGLVAPNSGDYAVSSGSSRLLGAPLYFNTDNGTPTDAGNPARVVRFDDLLGVTSLPEMTSWSARSMSISGGTRALGLRADLWLTPSGTVAGSISNESNARIVGIVLQAFGSQVVPVGDLAPGATRTVSLPTASSGADQNSIGDAYGSLAWRGARLVPANDAALGAGSSARLASIVSPAPFLARIASTMLSDGAGIATNPGESLGERFQHISQLVLGQESPAHFNAVTAVGWTSAQSIAIAVNGAQVPRKDTVMIVDVLPISLHNGPFVLNQSSLPVRFAGSTQDLQASTGSSGITLSPNSSADFVAMLPMPPASRRMVLGSLTLTASTAGAGGAISSESTLIWNWATEAWVPVDLSGGQATIRDPQAFVNRAGAILIRLSAQSSSLGLSDPNIALTIGATGEVR